jgi:Fe-S cluster assembly iron-binding protein IscA
MSTCKLPDCFPTSIESFESLPVELKNNCEYTLYGCDANKKEKEVLDEKFALISKEYNFLPLQHKKIGGCAGTQYGCNATTKPSTQPELTKPFDKLTKPVDKLIEPPRLIGGCAGTQYGCNANKSEELMKKPPPPRLIGGCAGTQYGCDANGNARGPPVQTELVSEPNNKLPRLIGGCAGTQYGCDANGNARGPPTQPELIKVPEKNRIIPEQNRIVPESKSVKSESKNIVISEKINDESDEYNIIHISIGVIIITFLLYFLFKR